MFFLDKLFIYIIPISICFNFIIQFILPIAFLYDLIIQNYYSEKKHNNNNIINTINTKNIKKLKSKQFNEIFVDEEKKKIFNSSVIKDNIIYTYTQEELEQKWKSCILIEYVEGQGNIIMFYDYYKKGFCYYSDISSVPYSILIEIVYNYILTYKCISFINNIEDNTEIYTENLNKKNNSVYKINNFEKNLINNRVVSTQKDKLVEDCSNKEVISLNEINYKIKIIRIGKTCDFSFLLKNKKNIKKNTENNIMSYKNFKELQNKKTQ